MNMRLISATADLQQLQDSYYHSLHTILALLVALRSPIVFGSRLSVTFGVIPPSP